MPVEYPPIARMNYIPNIDDTGAKKGFTTVNVKNGKKYANYNNEGRFTLTTDGPVVTLAQGGEQKNVPYSEYRKNPEAYDARRTKWGIICRLGMMDFDHGHEVTLFLNNDPEDLGKLDWFGDRLTDEIEKAFDKYGTLDGVVFSFGKEESDKGTQGRRFIRCLGLKEDIALVEDPASYNAVKQERMLKEQAPAPEQPTIQNFVLNEQEKYLLDMVDQLAKTGNPGTTTREKLVATLEAGYNGRKTSHTRATYIAQNAEKYLNVMKLED